VESNLITKNPKLNVTNIRSPFAAAGGGSGLGNVGQGGTSKIGTLAKIVRKNRISINSLVKSQEVQDEKITRLKNIVQTKQQNIGKKSPVGTQDKLGKSLAETNQILVQIQQELMRASALRSQEERARRDRTSRGASKAKFKKEESQLEKSSKKMRKAVGEKAEQSLKPVKGIFGRIMDFLGPLSLGIAANAILEWLKDEENKKKIEGWFNWIKDNWKWMAITVGAIALLPLVSTIMGVISTLGSIVGLAGPLFAFLANPVTLTVLGTLAAVALGTFALGKAAEWGIDKVRIATYGEGNVKKGIFATKLLDNYGRISTQKDRDKLTDEEKNTAKFLYQYDQMLKDRQTTNDQLYRAKEQLRLHGDKYGSTDIDKRKIAELEKKLQGQDASISMAETQGVKIQGKNLQELFNIYSTTGALPTTSIQARKMGGPVTAGRPYLVGENGPELMVPNIDGTVINNMKTEKIYQTISSRRKGRGGINMVNLPPITNKLPPPELPSMGDQATDVPDIASANPADRYRQMSSSIYGIMV